MSAKKRTSKKNKDILKEIGIRLKIIITALNTTQKNIADEARIPYQTLQNWLSGKVWVGSDFLYWLVKEKNINANFILTGKGEIFLHD